VRRKADGAVWLQTQGSPGTSFDIQTSVDLVNWLDLGIVIADTNGLVQFADTDATNHAARYYIAKPK
jgi:hypothetical protein